MITDVETGNAAPPEGEAPVAAAPRRLGKPRMAWHGPFQTYIVTYFIAYILVDIIIYSHVSLQSRTY